MDGTHLIRRIPHAPAWRQALATFIDHPRTQTVIIAVIILNAIILGLEAVPSVMAYYARPLKVLDKICLGIFVIEILIKGLAYRHHFFRSGWNCFDFIVVAIALVPAAGPMSVLRSLRVLRVLRLITAIPSLKRVVAAFLHAIPGLSSVGVLLLILMFVAAVMANGFFAASHPEWFGSLGASFYTLFQIMTLESWSMGIVRPLMETHPYAWGFFVPYIIVATFAMLNLFIGVIVSTIQELATSEAGLAAAAAEPSALEAKTDTAALIARLEADLEALKRALAEQRK
ncbi:MAG: ion transporter [Planctomycetota bacterium]|nr:MAG: ion transporter [Planctomycetota bacterium]